MARAMWTGMISFGMVTIPVKLYTATHSHNVAFHLLHEKCDTRIKEQRWCPHCEQVVNWEDIVKGYEYTKSKYVEVTEEDFEKVPLPSRHTIELSAFVPKEEIDPIYLDATYYVSVDEPGAQKAYKLLLEAMRSKEVVALATISFRNKERLCAIRPVDGRLQLHTLLYDDEIKANDTPKPSSVRVSAQEKKMAASLVDALADDFEPAKFKDKYQMALKKLINAKLAGRQIKETEEAKPTAASDLMEALRASIDKTRVSQSSNGHRSAGKKRPKHRGAA